MIKAIVHGRPQLAQIIGTSRIERHAHLEAGFTRTAYGQVWDTASQSLDAARVSVCGTSDAEEWQRSGEATAGDVATETAIAAVGQRARDRLRRRPRRPLPRAALRHVDRR